MEQIKIDNQYVDPYFIIGCVETDSEQFITKAFKKKAKMWHPDKISKQDSLDPVKVQNIKNHFKILVDSYEYIINKKRSFTSKREHISVPKSNFILTKSIDNSNELDLFNKEFNKLNIEKPTDFGYKFERVKDIKDYESFEHKPYKMNFKNTDEFNKTFEYVQQNINESTSEVSLYHTTTDGFNGYNGSDLGGNASVSSYNGLMIVGDTFGQSGLGYYDSNYSDYKKTFEGPKNPASKLDIPNDFKQKGLVKPMSLSESKKQLELRMTNRNEIESSIYSSKVFSKNEFKKQEKLLLDNQAQNIKTKLEHDKNMILQYQDLFTDKGLIQNALNGNLISSPDYCDEYSIDKRNLQTKM